MIKPYVEKVVAEYLGTPQGDLHVDDDGSIPIRRGSTAYFVRLLDGEPPLVQVYSTMLYEVPRFKSSPLLNSVLGGWKVGLLETAESGPTFTVITTANTTNAFPAGSLRPITPI